MSDTLVAALAKVIPTEEAVAAGMAASDAVWSLDLNDQHEAGAHYLWHVIATDLPRIASTVGAWPEEVKHVLFRLLLTEVVLDANPVALTKAALNIRAWEEGHLIRLELVAALLSLLAPTTEAAPDA